MDQDVARALKSWTPDRVALAATKAYDATLKAPIERVVTSITTNVDAVGTFVRDNHAAHVEQHAEHERIINNIEGVSRSVTELTRRLTVVEMNQETSPQAPVGSRDLDVLVCERFKGMGGIEEGWVNTRGDYFVLVGPRRTPEIAERVAELTLEIVDALYPVVVDGNFRWSPIGNTVEWRRIF